MIKINCLSASFLSETADRKESNYMNIELNTDIKNKKRVFLAPNGLKYDNIEDYYKSVKSNTNGGDTKTN